MATIATPRTGRATPPASRRSSSVSTSPPNSIAKGATARSAVSAPRVSSSLNSSVARRSSMKSPPPKTPSTPPPTMNDDVREMLSISLEEEIDRKEQLMVQLHNKDETISGLNKENNNFQSALNAAQTRLNQFYADQARMEEEMVTRIAVSEKLRTQVRELERDKRDIERRYNEQTSTFEAERQASYDNEQHLKSRIQSLTQARKQPLLDHTTPTEPERDEAADTHEETQVSETDLKKPPIEEETHEPAEITSLRLELSTLSTSYSSLQNTLILLQTQLVDLKRVNHELQEENESYMILLREKTLSGQFDVMRQMGGSAGSEVDDDDVDVDVRSLSSTTKSVLDPVEEELGDSFEDELERSLGPRDTDSHSDSSRNARQHRSGRSASLSSGNHRGETLAGLPLTGPGLDLAAELGRAENKDVLDGGSMEEQPVAASKVKRNKKSSTDIRGMSQGLEPIAGSDNLDALRTEVKSLKDANKALSLYASKIIDRIISQEGFEHVLAVDFDKMPPTPTNAGPKSPIPAFSKPPAPKPRPASAIFAGRSTYSPTPAQDANEVPEKSTTFTPAPLSPNSDAANRRDSKAQRRSLSFDWSNFSMFGGATKKENPSLRPLTLKPGAAPVTGVGSARKLDTEEDEEDRRERDRLQATMKLMGIEQPTVEPPTPIVMTPPSMPSTSPPIPAGRSRWSFFGGAAQTPGSETSSIHSNPSIYDGQPASLTHEALQHAEAADALAALDEKEKSLSAELARGGAGGFTEIPRRSSDSRRSKKSRLSGAGSSGSTVFSAGDE